MVALFERDQDIAVTGSGHGAVPECQVEAAVGNADIIDNRVDLTGGNHFSDFTLDVCCMHFSDNISHGFVNCVART